MKTFFLAILMGAVCIAAPKLSTGGARNAASYNSTTSQNGGIAQGARFVLLGKDLGPAETVTNNAYPLGVELGGVMVKVTVGDAAIDAWVLSASATKIVAMLPSSATIGKGKVALTFNGETSEADIEVVSRAVGLFSAGLRGAGQAIARTVEDDAAVLVNASAKPGQQIRLRATGLGSAEGDEAGGPTPKTFDASEFEVRIGDKVATVAAAIRTEIAGVDELTVEIPSGVDGCFAPVVVKAGEKFSNFVTIPVAANGGFCSSNLVSGSTIEGATANGGEVRVGSISLTRIAISLQQGEFVTDAAAGSFQKYKVEEFGVSSTSQTEIALGSCMVFNNDLIVDDEAPEASLVPPVDLGVGNISINGPKGLKTVPNVKGTFSLELGSGVNIQLPPGIPSIPGLPASPLYLDPGNYTISGSGGEDVGAFNVQVQLNPVDWTNPAVATAVNRAQPLTLNWSGGNANDYVMALGTSATRAGSGTFVCIARASAGTITVGTHILQNLPASSQEGSILGLFSITEPKLFEASGLDSGSVVFSRMAARQANYR